MNLPTLEDIKGMQEFEPNFIVLAITGYDNELINIEHMVTYEHTPTDEDMNSLREEMNTDEEFEFVGRESELTYILLTADEYNEFLLKMGSE